MSQAASRPLTGDRPEPSRPPAEAEWHTLDTAHALALLGTDGARGLTPAEAARRLAEYGPNELPAGQRVSAWAILMDQFKNILIIILLVAVGLSAALDHGLEALAIGVIVLFAVLLGFIQEYRAERAIEALRQMAAPQATVLRDGEERLVPAGAVVPGDIIVLRAGDRVPADARLVESINLQMEEAALTGESVAVEKHTRQLPQPDLPVGDRKNMAYSGTAATYGRGRAVVVATGTRTEFGKIAQLLQTVETGKTPLQHNLDRVGHALARAAFAVVVVIVGLGLLRGQPWLDMLIFGIALAVAVVPEALPAVVTISLALGVQRMVKRHALIRRLPAVETLGSVSVICSDKTGTLTKDEMTARKAVVAGHLFDIGGAGYDPHGVFAEAGTEVDPPEALLAVLRAGALASDARLLRAGPAGPWEIKGDPTEGALVVAAAKAGLDKGELEQRFPRVHEVPFTSETKRMTTVHQTPAGLMAYAKGAPEVILEACSRVLDAAGERPLAAAERDQLLAQARELAGQALRVLAIAQKAVAAPEEAEHGLTCLGLVGLIDPPRPEAKAAIAVCRQAGIKPVMITGDHPL
ncbi:MAG: HAD-IC family P-type ATPase, partial [Anaerolineales bacterium]|nr:HAD-IC family P-type ATPase [Anaerolineales bacterium]